MKKHWRSALTFAALAAVIAGTSAAVAEHGSDSQGLTVSPTALTFNATVNSSAPPPQSVSVTAARTTTFTVRTSVKWLSVSPSGTLSTNRTLAVTANPAGLSAGTYNGAVAIASNGVSQSVSVTLTVSRSAAITVSPQSLSFSATAGGAAPAAQTLAVSAPSLTSFTASASAGWIAISPSGTLSTNQNISVSLQTAGLAAGTYSGGVAIASASGTETVPVSLTLTASTSGGTAPPPVTSAGYKIIGWNDLGMHCMDGKDYSVFGVLPPYNTIHAHLIDPSGTLITAPTGYTITYQAVNDPLTNSINTTSAPKSNFWQYAAALGFGLLKADVGLKGFAMPGAGNTPQSMNFNTTDNTWLAEGIPVMPYADAPGAPYPVNYFPMMRLVAKNSSGVAIASTDIVTPTSDEMTCSACHSSTTGTTAARPSAGWVGNPDAAKDVKLNILRKHDDRFKSNTTFQKAVLLFGYNAAGLEATSASKPILCANCHATNALGMAGVSGIPAFTTSMHSLHSQVTDPATGQTMESGTTRDTCYRCHPGPNTKCLRGAMATAGAQCQSCHGPMSNVANAARKGWLDEPTCQSCHTGTAVSNSGQIVYTSVFSSGTTVRTAKDLTFATNANTPSTGLSMYRYSRGHGGLQCEACHGSTHAEYATPIANDNVQSTQLQGHTGMISECSACHSSVPSTANGGPHGLHPLGASWVSAHPNLVERSGPSACQTCHGTDYRGTVLSKTQADRTLAGRSFARGTVIGCYSCHNGPNGG